MQITLLGVIVIPLSLLFAFNPVRLLQLTLVCSVFEAAAAAVFGGFGLQPAMVPALLFVAYVVLQYALGMRYPGDGAALRVIAPLLGLLAYACFSAWLLPRMFEGQVLVWPQKVDPFNVGLVPLQFSFGNVTQTLYLAIDILFAVAVAIFLTRRAVPFERIIAAYLASGYLVVALVFWQLAHSLAGVPFPEEFLHSNPSWQVVSQSLGSVPRMQGPFTEPAGLAFYLSGLSFCCLWLSVKGYRTLRPNLLLALSMLSMLLSTSTTGLATLVLGLPMVLAAASAGGDPTALSRIGKTVGLLALAGVIAIGPLFVLKPSLVDAVQVVVGSTLSKGDSESYNERTGVDAAALAVVQPTYGLGVGWGSFRSSSLVPGLFANGGAVGAALVTWLALRLWRFSRRLRARRQGHPGQVLVDGFSAAMCGQLAAAILSSPTIGSLAFYLQLGCVTGVLARIMTETSHARQALPQGRPGPSAAGPSYGRS